MAKFGNCPFCYGCSILLTLLFSGLYVLGRLFDVLPAVTLPVLLFAAVLLLAWTLTHLAFFVVRYSRTLKSLPLPASRRLPIVLRVSYAFTRSSVHRTLRFLFTRKE